MSAGEIKNVNNTTLCNSYAQVKWAMVLPVSTTTMEEEIKQRNLDCNQILAPYRQASASQSLQIDNSDSPQCRGVSVIGAGRGEYFARGVYGLYVRISNTSGQRKSVTLDIKYFTQGVQGAYVNVPSGTHWEQAGPFVLRADETTGAFPVMTNLHPNDHIVAVTVLGCGG